MSGVDGEVVIAHRAPLAVVEDLNAALVVFPLLSSQTQLYRFAAGVCVGSAQLAQEQQGAGEHVADERAQHDASERRVDGDLQGQMKEYVTDWWWLIPSLGTNNVTDITLAYRDIEVKEQQIPGSLLNGNAKKTSGATSAEWKRDIIHTHADNAASRGIWEFRIQTRNPPITGPPEPQPPHKPPLYQACVRFPVPTEKCFRRWGRLKPERFEMQTWDQKVTGLIPTAEHKWWGISGPVVRWEDEKGAPPLAWGD